MKSIVAAAVAAIFFSYGHECLAQSAWNWKRFHWFAKETKEVEPVELTDEPASTRWPPATAESNARPHSWEWRTPAFMRRMNENNVRLWRTTKRNVGHWASSTGTAIRNTTYDTWDAITRAATPKAKDEPDSVEPPSPNFGGVQEFLARPKLKF